jgi:hypothetical protein
MGRDPGADDRWERFLEPEGPPPPPDGSTGPGAPDHRGASGPAEPGDEETHGGGPLRWDLLEDDEGEAEHRSTRGRVLLLAALVPWLIVAGILWRTGDDPTLGAHDDGHTDHVTADGDADADEREEGSPPADEGVTGWDETPEPWDATEGAIEDLLLPEPDALRFGARASAGAGEAAGVAHLVAREWLDDIGVPLGIEAIERSATGAYVEHIIVESVDIPAPDAAVVTLVAVLLDVEEGTYSDARAVRIAVPVHLAREGARPAGTPWWLPGPDLRPITVGEQALDDDPTVLADAGAALQAAGYREIDVRSVALSDRWPIVVSATGVAPGQSAPAEHRVWLRQHLDGLVVAGWLPDVITDDEGRPLDERRVPAGSSEEVPEDPSPTPTEP